MSLGPSTRAKTAAQKKTQNTEHTPSPTRIPTPKSKRTTVEGSGSLLQQVIYNEARKCLSNFKLIDSKVECTTETFIGAIRNIASHKDTAPEVVEALGCLAIVMEKTGGQCTTCKGEGDKLPEQLETLKANLLRDIDS